MKRFFTLSLSLLLLGAIGCNKSSEPAPTGTKYVVVDTRTDNFDYARAKANAQDAMASVPDLACMVGLFAYNAPQCLEAAKEAGKIGKIKIVSFDEQNSVLQGIIDGHVHGTVSQQPYYYGYESVRILNGLANGDKSVLPPGGFLEVPIVEVRKSNVEKFWSDLRQMQKAGASPASASPGQKKKKVAYVTNGVDPFWDTAAAGVRAAEKDFGIECQVLMPPKGIIDQKRMVEGLLARGIDGIAISPIDARNQVDLLDQAAARCPVITHDSDAPNSKRQCFVGMDNYKAGRAAGRLIKEALPNGGKVMLFVGRLEQLNAQQRRQGVIDELLDHPAPAADKADDYRPKASFAGAGR